MMTMEIHDNLAVFGENECIYQCVLDDFKNAKFIGIITFNISSSTNSQLLKSLQEACLKGTDAVVITNIPKRFPSYYGHQYALAARKMINSYMRQLNPQNYGMRLSPYFSFHNHAKIVMTDNIVYWGSSNYSDESSRNFECGTVSTDKELIGFLKDSLFPEVQSKSVPYFKYNFAMALANIEALIPACKIAREELRDAAFIPWSDYDTNFEEKWIYRTTESGLTLKFLRGFTEFFSEFDNALNVIDDIVDEYSDLDELPEKVEILRGLYEDYMRSYDNFNESISSLFENLEEVARYDASDEACAIIADDYGMEAYDENLDYYAEKAMTEAANTYEEIIIGSEQTVRDALVSLDSMIEYFEQLNTSLHQLLEVSPEIDNTSVN